MRVALTGNPNSGKTTMYNALTGRNEKVGNWAGVTVERKEHQIKKSYLPNDKEVIAVDLPGAYSMSPFTSEESITSAYVRGEKPDVIVNIVDGTNLSRSLFFTTQLLELGIPVVVALNKGDINKKKNTKINAKLLQEKLNCPVVETVSTHHEGLKAVVAAAISVAGKSQAAPYTQGDIDLTVKAVVEAADRARFDFVNKLVNEVETREVLTNKINKQDKIDAVLTNKWLGIPIFAVVMFLVFGISQAWLGPWIADLFCGLLEAGQGLVADALANDAGELGIWASILVDGIIGGVIAVVGFLPLVMIMYFLIALLEDCGYMARVSVILDPIFKKVGLSGKSIIPFIIGTGCAIPGVMACRTIRNERERRATAMLAPFMPCGAKLPVIALFAGLFFNESPWIGTLMYFVGILIILGCAFLINKLTGHKNRKSFFIIELPEYKAPSLLGACKSMLSRGWSYIVKAGTIILVCNFVVHVMQTFDWTFKAVEASESILHDIATPFAYVLAPIIGVVAWQLAAATVTGFIAKENVVGTIAVCYSITNFINVDDLVLESGAAEVAAIMGITKVAALAFLMFNLFSPPCFAAIGAMNAEIKDKKWLFAGIGLQFAVGFVTAFVVYFFGTLFTGANFTANWMPILGWAITAAIVGILVFLIIRKNNQLKAEYSLSQNVKK
ncbi:MAG: ferrous iron transporter B [Clostridia bacterium]|nr:ferrous iron transporter B [Clostridia bacterium]